MITTPENKPQPTGATSPAPTPQPKAPITSYHWWVVILASAGWLFDCMGQRIFVLGREPAMRELLAANATDQNVWLWGTLATTALMVGWGTGGLIFGMMSDRYGRVKAMILTLFGYTIFSAISGFSHGVIEFVIYRLLFGLGVGGMFGAATTLVAESVPAHFRTAALGSMQALSACGNMTASALSFRIIPGAENLWGHFSGWQVLFFVGVCPAILALPMWLILKEPEAWRKARAEAASGGGKRVGSIADLFGDKRWRHNTLVGICFGISGMVGLWGIGFFSPELITTAFKARPLQTAEVLDASGLCLALKSPRNPAADHIKAKLSTPTVNVLNAVESGKEPPSSAVQELVTELNRVIQGDRLYDAEAFKSVTLKKATHNLVARTATQKTGRPDVIFLNRQLVEQAIPGTIKDLQKTIDQNKSRGTLLQDVGALCGMFAFTFVAAYFNRRTAFFAAFALCLFSVAFVFHSLKTEADVYWMLPLLGFATLTPFAGYSIYFPEIFPTRLRGTGVGFCYNTVRYLAAPFPLLLGWLSTHWAFRTVAVVMSGIYLVGLVALIWAPETKGKPLPQD